MKVKLYFENEKAIAKSGIGRALKHQQTALSLNNIDYSSNHDCDDYDILHINTVLFGSFLEVKKAKHNNKKVVYHAHSTMEDFKNSFMFSNAVASLYKKALIYQYSQGDVIVTPTPYSKRILESYGIDKPIYAISNGVDASRFEYDQHKVDEFRNYFGLDENQKVVISVGWLFERKGFDTFCEIALQFPDVTFIWFGDKNLSMPTPNILKWINNKPENVILPGYISGDIIIGAYLSADVFFFPSREETEGIVVLEALAAKCQVLVRDIGVYDGWLEDHKNCLKASTNEQFVDCLTKLLQYKHLDLVEQGYQTALSKGLKQIGEQLKDVYEKVLSEDL